MRKYCEEFGKDYSIELRMEEEHVSRQRQIA